MKGDTWQHGSMRRTEAGRDDQRTHWRQTDANQQHAIPFPNSDLPPNVGRRKPRAGSLRLRPRGDTGTFRLRRKQMCFLFSLCPFQPQQSIHSPASLRPPIAASRRACETAALRSKQAESLSPRLSVTWPRKASLTPSITLTMFYWEPG